LSVIYVSAGILVCTDGRILITERTDDGPFHGMWEFPGGKIADGESAEEALRRELREEIGIDVEQCAAFMRLRHDYPDRSVDLRFFKVSRWRGNPVGLENQQMRWVVAAEIEDGLMLPADLPVIDALRNSS
jgi:8-oxo-dGTP diphosphatase